ncbi:proton extrusion protein PcxA [Myxosarcina sp. GI1]|uniref:proton extrusion protein PcxA n=1 Tax=Myxosarcina sp. GI1 TaxID=1541065 RepID=UPI0005669D82|nr:proton extrusion protein PcxA [Myxosarcina sp. GI1]
MKFNDIVNLGRNWLSATPERSLDAAYRAAIKIKAIEDEHFNGRVVSAESADYSESVVKVFQADVKNYLNTIKMRLAEFRSSRSLRIFADNRPENSTQIVRGRGIVGDREATVINKLNFIDSVVSRYNKQTSPTTKTTAKARRLSGTARNGRFAAEDDWQSQRAKRDRKLIIDDDSFESKRSNKDTNIETITDKTSVLPRSFMRTLNRIGREIDPKADDTEEEVIKRFRQSRNKTAISIRFLLLLIIVPLMTHQITKTFIITPIVKNYFASHQEQTLFINTDLEEEAFVELQRYQEKLDFESLIGIIPPLSDSEKVERIHVKAEEIAADYRNSGINAIGNIFADFCSLLAFGAIIYFCQREILVIKSFIDEIAYGLSDSAKAFLIILLTDMFVGYHSPHGWEVILEGISRHLGLPENRDFNFLFIATFPVILDTVLKYWIFRYLNRISPSSVATYKNMNE